MNLRKKLAALAALFTVGVAHAGSWSSQAYTIAMGDFNGDGKTDVLYIADDAGGISGIALSDGAGPNIDQQTWRNGYLGLDWHGKRYAPIVADFTGSGGDDVLLQATVPGEASYLIINDGTGHLTTKAAIPYDYAGQKWSADEHRLIAGDFDGDGRFDVFMQGMRRDVQNAVMLSSGNGQFSSSQVWSDQFLGVRWTFPSASVAAAKIDGDSRWDLFVLGKPDIVLIDYDVPIPVPSYRNPSSGIFMSRTSAGCSGTAPLFCDPSQRWGQKDQGGNWAGSLYDVVLGDFNGDGRTDVFLQSRSSSRPSQLFFVDSNGQMISGNALPASAAAAQWASDTYRVFAANVNGSGPAELYLQPKAEGGSNYVGWNIASGSYASTHTPSTSGTLTSLTTLGRTAGAFDVSDNGEARYSVPIFTPPGSHALSPQLSFEYQSRAGKGFAGVGLRVAGFSAITRCARTVAQDGSPLGVTYESGQSDKYCLDGNRLRIDPANSSVYRTELETFSRIKSFTSGGAGYAVSAGPQWFQVERKDGLIYEYGKTENSRIRAGGTAYPRVWALSRVRDRSGNYIDFDYYADTTNGSFRPYQVRYTGNTNVGTSPPYTVEFVYSDRTGDPDDVSVGYSAGYIVREPRRLERVDVSYGSVVRRYLLGYEAGPTSRSRVTSLQECSFPGGSQTCFAPTSFQWQGGPASWGSAVASDASTTAPNAVQVDLNGDGRTDLLFAEGPSFNAACFALATTTGYGSKTCTSNTWSSTAPAQTRWIVKTGSPRVMDSDGDGRQELLQYAPSISQWQLLKLNASDALISPALGFGKRALVSAQNDSVFSVGDANGDGRTDIVYFRPWEPGITDDYSNQGFWVRYAQSGGTFSAPVQLLSTPLEWWPQTGSPTLGSAVDPILPIGDVNGDSRTDFIFLSNQSKWIVIYSAGTGSTNTYTRGPVFEPSPAPTANLPPVVADFNGDGIPDLLVKGPSGGSVLYGTGSASTPLTTGVSPGISPASWATVSAADMDGDGRADLVYANGSVMAVARSLGEGFASGVDTSVSSSGAVAPFDFNGDGIGDFVSVPSSTANAPQAFINQSAPLDLLRTATDAYGNYVTFTHASIAQTSSYQRVSDGNVAEAVKVVTSYTASNGIGGSYQQTFTYQDAMRSLDGRGFLGFRQQSIVDSRTGFRTTKGFEVDFPQTGYLSSATTYQANGTTPVRSYSAFVRNHSYSSADGLRYFPWVATYTDITYEVGGTENGQDIRWLTYNAGGLSEGAIGPDFDTGTIQDSSISVSERANSNGLHPGVSFEVRTKHTSLTNDTNNANTWCIGRPTATEETRTQTLAEDVSTSTRHSSMSWDVSKCRPTLATAEPGNADWQVQTAYGYDDDGGNADPDFGNLTSVTVTGAGMAARQTRMKWDSVGQFPEYSYNALNQETKKGWDYSLGLQTSERDPNQQTVSWGYDSFGRKTSETRPDGTSTRWAYKDCGTYGCTGPLNKSIVIATQLGYDGSTISDDWVYLDKLDRPLVTSSRELSGGHNRIDREYDEFGRISRESSPCWWTGCAQYWTAYKYDPVGRLTQMSRPASDGSGPSQCAFNDFSAACAQTQFFYEGLTTRTIDAEGKQTTQVKDGRGRAARTADHNGYYIDLTFDLFDDVVAVKDPSGTLRTNSYSITGVPITQSDVDRGNWTFDANALGEIEYTRDAKTSAPNWTTHATFDALGRMTERQDITDGITATWHWGDSAISRNIGHLEYMQIAGAGVTTYRETYSYDGTSRPLKTTYTEGVNNYDVDFTYSSTTGLPETLTYPTSTSGYRLKLQYDYNYGLLQKVRDFNAPGTTFWQANAADVNGHVVDAQLGNGVRVVRGFDQVTGSIDYIQSGPGGGASLQNLGYLFDRVGNLSQRQDNNQGLSENFYYDNLHRLDYSTLKVGTASPLTNADLGYDPNGNVTSKVGVGSYDYTTQQAGCSYYAHSQPHAVRNAGGAYFCYDANGNMTSRNGTTMLWYGTNLPKSITKDANNSSIFEYTPDRQRWRHDYKWNGTTYTHVYLGSLLEKVTQGANTDWKHYIFAGGEPAALYTRSSGGSTSTNYMLGDHLGSTDVITDSAGAALVRESFDAFGKRRGAAWSGSPSPADLTTVNSLTRRGFTFHEQLDSTDFIHMNGRVYDPALGRFASADVLDGDASLTLSFNLYSYAFNNPLTYVDPTGFAVEISCSGCRTPAEWQFYSAFGMGTYPTWTALANGSYLSVDIEGFGDYASINSQLASAAAQAHDFAVQTSAAIDRQAQAYVANAISSPSSQRMMKFMEATATGTWGDTLSSGADFIAGEWRDAYSTPDRAILTTMSMVPIVGVEASAARALPNSALVVRGGNAANQTAAKINAAIGPSRTPGVTGFSAQCNGGTCLAELGQFLRNKQVGVTTVGEIRQLGGDVIATPGFGHHVTVTGVTGEAVSPLFRIVTNPNPLVGP